jgi:two-component system, cell cycle response regulator DivK
MSKRILVVEDQPDNRQIIRDMLATTDYAITEAENGEEALAAIAKQRPDLILMDIQLPIMDGYTATSQIKADHALRSIPIIAVTSYALSGEEKRARAAGCDDLCPSPLARVNYWRKLGSTCPKPGIYSCRIPQPTSHRVQQREQSVPGRMMVAFEAKRHQPFCCLALHLVVS